MENRADIEFSSFHVQMQVENRLSNLCTLLNGSVPVSFSPSITIRATQKNRISLAVSNMSVG